MKLTRATVGASATDSLPTTVGSFQNKQVFPREQMSVLATVLPCIYGCGADSAKGVLALGDWFQVVWIHATRVATDMVKIFGWVQWPDEKDVSQSMRPPVFALKPVVAVSVLDGRGPVPALVGLLNLAPEAVSEVVHNCVPLYGREA
jgi:hypothetical protein